MANSVQHVRGSKDEWELHDAVLPEGELGLVLGEDGRYSLKIGDGKRSFSALPYPGDEIVKISARETEVVLRDRAEFRLGEMRYLMITIPDAVSEDFCASLVFDSGDEPTTIEYNTPHVKFSGVDISAGVFVPSEYSHYSLLFWYDGAFQCAVRGVSNVD